VANLLEAVGYDVHREYYVNDGGRQMDILAVSVWLRYLERLDETVPFPANGYRGDYIRAIAASLYETHGDSMLRPASEVAADLPPDEPDGGDKEGFIDALVRRARALLGADWDTVFEHGVAELVAEIRNDLAGFGVEYEDWFSERSLFDSDAVERALAQLDASGYLYEHEGAKWFRSTEFGDEKDRVVVRENGDKTYFGADIAYHWNKIERGHERVIDVLGADHHGYIARMHAALQALGVAKDRFEVLLVQFAALWRGGEKIPMSTRAGQFVTLRELREEVGADAARFFYVLRRNDQHLDFDLDLAKAQTQDNPVYYIQYAHARIRSVMRQLEARGLRWDRDNGLAHLDRLGTPHETNLIEALERYPELIEQAAANREPHRVCYYLLEEVANAFHTWYNAEAFLVDDADLRDARLALIQATGQVIRNALALVGVSAPEEM
jgi:arginyl-tRNA synthetase